MVVWGLDPRHSVGFKTNTYKNVGTSLDLDICEHI